MCDTETVEKRASDAACIYVHMCVRTVTHSPIAGGEDSAVSQENAKETTAMDGERGSASPTASDASQPVFAGETRWCYCEVVTVRGCHAAWPCVHKMVIDGRWE